MAHSPDRVTVVVDARDDATSMQAALHAHRPEQGRITVQPTPANSRPAALAHDVLYALGKRLASGPDTPDAWLDSVGPAWQAAAAWSIAAGVRHMVVTRTHLLSTPRLEQLLAWRATTGVQLTVLWQTSPQHMPTVLARTDHHRADLDQLHGVLAEPGPVPARPFFPLAPGAPAPPARRPTPPQQTPTLPTAPPPGRKDCVGATAAAQLLPPSPALPVPPAHATRLATLGHPLIAGALSALAFTHTTQIALRCIRDIDIDGDLAMLRTHSPGHRHCRLYTVPAWARSLLAGARAHHRLAARRPQQEMLAPALSSGARHLRAHAKHLSGRGVTSPALAWTAGEQEHSPALNV